MCDKAEFKVCRLCLNSHGLLMNVFGENSKLQFMLEKTIEDLIDVKVVEDANYPWLVCSTCMEKLTEFRLFKRRCAECLSEFYNRIQEGCNPTARKDCITNREKIVSDAIDKKVLDAQDDTIIIKEEIDDASEYCTSLLDPPMVASMQEGCSHWSDNVEAGNLDHSQHYKLGLSTDEEKVIKKEWEVNDPQEEGGLEGDALQLQGTDKGQDVVGNIFHKCQICNIGFAEKDILEVHTLLLHHVKPEEIRCDVDPEALNCTSDVETDAMTYKCAICLIAFSEKCKLKSHLLLHTREGLFKYMQTDVHLQRTS
ncbi:uncharacterized protein [Hetaerina americana]|uniref:uncharacterized protein n=1 Tax=Hetaerina americana TaxID=62018 RepID=UPI003A7F3476